MNLSLITVRGLSLIVSFNENAHLAEFNEFKPIKLFSPFNYTTNHDSLTKLNPNIDNPLSFNFEILRMINEILIHSQNMPLDKRAEYCKNQRYFMIQYLKELSKKE